MADQWYFAKVESRLGPFSAEQLKELAAAGQIRPQDMVWKEGVEAGVPAARVKSLFAGPQVKAPLVVPNSQIGAEPSPHPSPSGEETTPPATAYSDPNDMELAPGEPEPWRPAVDPAPTERAGGPTPASEKPPPRPQESRKRRVTGVKGGVVISQDGQVVKYRKHCLRCSYADTNVATMPIRSGVTRVNFYCPKCKKNQQVEVQAVG